MELPMIEFHLDTRSGLSPYQQLVQQVRHALRLGLLNEGDQLPKVKDVVASLAINPNTVLKAYRELEHDGLVGARPGVGTFVTRSLNGASPPSSPGRSAARRSPGSAPGGRPCAAASPGPAARASTKKALRPSSWPRF